MINSVNLKSEDTNMSKEDNSFHCSPEISLDEDSSGNWNFGCQNCEYCTEDDDDLMNLFYSAELWYSDGKEEEQLLFSERPVAKGTDPARNGVLKEATFEPF